MLAAPGAAQAQTMPSIDMRTWQPSSDADASMVLEPAVTAGAWRWNLGVWAQYAQNSVVYRDRGGMSVRPVAHFVGFDAVAGLGLGSRVALGFDVPVFAWQNGDSRPPTSCPTARRRRAASATPRCRRR